MAELGNLTVSYFPLSTANVNCENPHRKPISQPPVHHLSTLSGFFLAGRFSYDLHSTILGFTASTQGGGVCSLRESDRKVQSRKEEYFEVRNSFQ
jgi:hypothetical protein